ncbi:Iron-sulfur assembly protein 1 [Coccidioides posadasii str. Silveira]|uniref:Iron-sulfur assembly protein 1 n=3 Tax=Coccidioides posadasii TaxID=199306 RepID=E9CW76_COCPS|nr:Iron-sulfur cluster assembly accessory family protein [Coccidioides posadasii C735 delta SOWgp]EER23600.1 Iron-sulfur cluster assembly accessory family protein [Coccidioides posadasii C735 delta SOWgp]EFW21552.1 iron-sulfur cluster assembly accessory protein Isa1 [Coccidioides posadasii str. Silveira]KMM65026.1 iron sulfur assembly protein 1 [Coccidioides posadasii RMSCC 3488]QVM07025.1 Iron-sulfur assembly protein 1 [Coccidioides posadasii str. Silveira]|eukprot:XP_003065745.1 Iron-sulfur cluster assembly accessory family protein [Coccidioides posadasii C735 delta SOWgp]
MSLFHNSVTSSMRLIYRDASRRACSQTTRAFSSCRQSYQSSKRELQTATAYRPQTLPEPFPPRNLEASDHSISKAIPGIGGAELPSDLPYTKGPDRFKRYSLPESDAHKAHPLPTQTPATPATPPSSAEATKKPRRSKLRPRKAAMTLTPAAVEQIRNLLSQPDPKMIRVGVKNRGCSGLAYHLEFVEKPAPFDEVVEQDGIKVLIDSKALFSIIGSEMDWQEDKLASRFVFKNPNIKDECGCGESFMV